MCALCLIRENSGWWRIFLVEETERVAFRDGGWLLFHKGWEVTPPNRNAPIRFRGSFYIPISPVPEPLGTPLHPYPRTLEHRRIFPLWGRKRVALSPSNPFPLHSPHVSPPPSSPPSSSATYKRAGSKRVERVSPGGVWRKECNVRSTQLLTWTMAPRPRDQFRNNIP